MKFPHIGTLLSFVTVMILLEGYLFLNGHVSRETWRDRE